MKNYKFKADDDMDNILQIKHSIFLTVFLACRLVLTHNNIFYPCVKNMEKEIEKCVNTPNGFIENMHKVLETFSFEELGTFYNTTEDYFKKYMFDDKIRKGYVIENEDTSHNRTVYASPPVGGLASATARSLRYASFPRRCSGTFCQPWSLLRKALIRADKLS
jgi:hypothetical protein